VKIRKAISIAIMACLLVTQVATATWAEEVPTELTEMIEESAEQEETEANVETAETVEENEEAEEKAEAEAEAENIVLIAELDDVIVTLKADADAFEYEGELSLAVTPVDIEDTEAEAALDAVEKENVAKRVTYDITVLDDETEIEPVKEVKVSFELKEAPSGADGVNIYHHDEEEGIEKIATEVLGEDAEEADVTVEAATDSFSLYTVDFTYKDKTISIAGDTIGNSLDDIVSELGIEEKVEEAAGYQDVECTKEAEDNEVKNTKGDTLFSVYEGNDGWYVDAVNAFNTAHGLIVKTADGAEYKIKVTDAGAQTNDDCITFISDAAFSISVSGEQTWDGTLQYSVDKLSWQIWDVYETSEISAAQPGGTGKYYLFLRGNTDNTVITGSNYWTITTTAGHTLSCTGNIETLRGATGNDPSPTAMGDDCYMCMFYNCANLTTAPTLPATTLSAGCYNCMFSGCTSLTAAPALPATVLAERCYGGMFSECKNLTTAPALPADTMTSSCYASMFRDCTKLEEAPELLSTALESNCYSSMFNGCTSLTEAPALPATTLAEGCYDCMFGMCKKLETAPALLAETMVPYCYRSMFAGCESLTTAPALPADTLASSCYYAMFSGCKSLTTAPALPAATLAPYCYRLMFQGCSSLKVVQTTDASVDNKIFTCPQTLPTEAVDLMFKDAGGSFKGTPTSGNTYYYLPKVKYIDAEGKEQTCTNYTLVDDTLTGTWNEGWYVVTGDVTMTGASVTASGEVHLILCDECTLTVTGTGSKPGIGVSGENSLAIYAQSTGDKAGKLTATGGGKGAGIGGGQGGSGNNITINGGNIIATGAGGGAGIGGGSKQGTGGDGSNITINGGTVTATGAGGGAGIGGGYAGNGSDISINGGTVTATGANGGVGIGGGCWGEGSNIYAATDVIVKAGDSENPTTEIAHDATTDIAGLLSEKKYVITTVPTPTPTPTPIPEEKTEASEPTPVYTGSSENPVTDGVWNCGPGGVWTFRTNGLFRDTWGYVRLEDGRTGWFYFDKSGVMLTGWQLINGKWYYFNEAHDGTYGMMLANTTTSDGYRLGADGAWIR